MLAVMEEPLMSPTDDTLCPVCSSTCPFICTENTSGSELIPTRCSLTEAYAHMLMSGRKRGNSGRDIGCVIIHENTVMPKCFGSGTKFVFHALCPFSFNFDHFFICFYEKVKNNLKDFTSFKNIILFWSQLYTSNFRRFQCNKINTPQFHCIWYTDWSCLGLFLIFLTLHSFFYSMPNCFLSNIHSGSQTLWGSVSCPGMFWQTGAARF